MLLATFGAVAAFASALIVVPGPMADFFKWIAFGTRTSPVPSGDADRYVRLVHAIIGAVMLGWVVVLAGVAVGPLRRREAWAWWTIAGSVATWYVTDTLFSLATGFTGNAVMNTAIVIAFAVPLAGIRHQSSRSTRPPG